MKVMLLMTRRLDGPRSGRRVVLRTIRDALRASGHEVLCVCIDRTGTDEGVALHPPGVWRVAWNVLTRFVPGRRSLNECLYASGALARRVAALARRHGVELIVADMVRTAQLAERCGLPWVADLDDLLSRRYEQMAGDGADASVLLGYYAGQLPAWVRRPAALAARLLLRREARVLAQREVHYAQAADGVSLVAAEEAQVLAQRSGHTVRWMPMSAPVPAHPAGHVRHRPMSAVFVGGLDYEPNLAALRWYLREVTPHLARFKLDDLTLHVVGACPDRLRVELASPRVKLLGYVDDVGAELDRHQVFLAPIVSGTGLKTKVIEAMAAGLPVVGTPAAFRGLGAEHDRHAYFASLPIDFAQCLCYVSRHPDDAQRIALAGRELVRRHFSLTVLTERWGQWIDELAANRPA